MNTLPCEQLDDYLADGLPASQRAAFEAHLADCPGCRDQIELEGHIDRLLAQGAGQPVPRCSSLIDRVETCIRALQHRRRRRLAQCLTTAAAVAVLAGVWSLLLRPALPPQPQPSASNEAAPAGRPPGDVRPDEAAAPSKSPVRVKPTDPSTAIVVPVAMEDPNVSFVWLYPTVTPAPRDDGDGQH